MEKAQIIKTTRALANGIEYLSGLLEAERSQLEYLEAERTRLFDQIDHQSKQIDTLLVEAGRKDEFGNWIEPTD